MALAYLLTGSNVGNRAEYLAEADKRIAHQAGTIVKTSGIYETAPWGNTDQGAFLNKALMIDTSLSPEALLDCLLQVEKDMGRTRDAHKWQPRSIDIDILLYDDVLLDIADLHIPHPLLPERRFALVPLCEIAPVALYIRTHETIAVLLDKCSDSSLVSPWQLL